MGFSITILPDNYTFAAEARETILEAAKRHGLKLQQGCGDGACGLCKGNVLQGTVDHGKSTIIALPAEEREAGIALFCCAMPTSDLVIERREAISDWNMLDWDAPMG
ncbi:MAG: 2Fe-2S iron-sulfur cluster binding domain-containing protein [Betaproteobacteria bacterium]|nr:2Fe-2S iron-sulfur cluster binding domain-containing protein [Betaproteobacteria bacterium]